VPLVVSISRMWGLKGEQLYNTERLKGLCTISLFTRVNTERFEGVNTESFEGVNT
jgi:hypothetical protein